MRTTTGDIIEEVGDIINLTVCEILPGDRSKAVGGVGKNVRGRYTTSGNERPLRGRSLWWTPYSSNFGCSWTANAVQVIAIPHAIHPGSRAGSVGNAPTEHK